MRSVTFGVVGALIMSSAAIAADLPVKAAPVPTAPVLTWGGFYGGLNAGGDWGRSAASTSVVGPGAFFGAPLCFPPINGCVLNVVDVSNAGAQTANTHGFVGGAQIGYNWQTGNVVFGVEADFQYFRSSGSSSRTVSPLVSGSTASVTVTSSISTDWLFTLRPRLGWAVNNWLIYGTGGLAVSELKPSWTFQETAFGNTAANSFSKTKAGWTIGGGVEYMMPGRWVLGAEYLYVEFDDVTAQAPAPLPKGAFATGIETSRTAQI